MYSDKEIDKVFKSILEDIEHGYSLRTVLKNGDNPSSRTFYKWLDANEEKVKQYARACEVRAENIFEDILDIADDRSGDTITLDDGKKVFNSEFAARSRIKIDARKWMLGKLQPKKYGDKNTTVLEGGDKPVNIISLGNGIDPNEAT